MIQSFECQKMQGHNCSPGELWLSDGEAVEIEKLILPFGFRFSLIPSVTSSSVSTRRTPHSSSVQKRTKKRLFSDTTRLLSDNIVFSDSDREARSRSDSSRQLSPSSDGGSSSKIVNDSSTFDGVGGSSRRFKHRRLRGQNSSVNDNNNISSSSTKQSITNGLQRRSSISTKSDLADETSSVTERSKRNRQPAKQLTTSSATTTVTPPTKSSSHIVHTPSSKLSSSTSNFHPSASSTYLNRSSVTSGITGTGSGGSNRSPKEATLPTRSSRRRREVLTGHWEDACDHLLDRLTAESSSRWFVTPVDPDADGVLDYFEKVSSPMDFQTIRQKLHQGMYSHPFRYQEDIRTVFFNAFTYHEKGSLVWSDAFYLATLFEQLCKEVEGVNPYAVYCSTQSTLGSTSNSSSASLHQPSVKPTSSSTSSIMIDKFNNRYNSNTHIPSSNIGGDLDCMSPSSKLKKGSSSGTIQIDASKLRELLEKAVPHFLQSSSINNSPNSVNNNSNKQTMNSNIVDIHKIDNLKNNIPTNIAQGSDKLSAASVGDEAFHLSQQQRHTDHLETQSSFNNSSATTVPNSRTEMANRNKTIITNQGAAIGEPSQLTSLPPPTLPPPPDSSTVALSVRMGDKVIGTQMHRRLMLTQFQNMDVHYRKAALEVIKDELGINPVVAALDSKFKIDMDLLPSLKQKQIMVYLRLLDSFQRKKVDEGYKVCSSSSLQYQSPPTIPPVPPPSSFSALNEHPLPSTTTRAFPTNVAPSSITSIASPSVSPSNVPSRSDRSMNNSKTSNNSFNNIASTQPSLASSDYARDGMTMNRKVEESSNSAASSHHQTLTSVLGNRSETFIPSGNYDGIESTSGSSSSSSSSTSVSSDDDDDDDDDDDGSPLTHDSASKQGQQNQNLSTPKTQEQQQSLCKKQSLSSPTTSQTAQASSENNNNNNNSSPSVIQTVTSSNVISNSTKANQTTTATTIDTIVSKGLKVTNSNNYNSEMSHHRPNSNSNNNNNEEGWNSSVNSSSSSDDQSSNIDDDDDDDNDSNDNNINNNINNNNKRNSRVDIRDPFYQAPLLSVNNNNVVVQGSVSDISFPKSSSSSPSITQSLLTNKQQHRQSGAGSAHQQRALLPLGSDTSSSINNTSRIIPGATDDDNNDDNNNDELGGGGRRDMGQVETGQPGDDNLMLLDEEGSKVSMSSSWGEWKAKVIQDSVRLKMGEEENRDSLPIVESERERAAEMADAEI